MMSVGKRLLNVLLISLYLLLFWASVGTCSPSPTYQISENELTALEMHLTALEQNNEVLRTALNGSSEDLVAALSALNQSKQELNLLKAQLEACRIEAANAKNSLAKINDELRIASESFKASEREHERIESRLRNQRNIWEALFAVAVGVAIAR